MDSEDVKAEVRCAFAMQRVRRSPLAVMDDAGPAAGSSRWAERQVWDAANAEPNGPSK